MILGFILIMYDFIDNDWDNFVLPHHQNGLCVMIAVFITPLLGMNVRYFGRSSWWGALHFLLYMYITIGGIVQWQWGLELLFDIDWYTTKQFVYYCYLHCSVDLVKEVLHDVCETSVEESLHGMIMINNDDDET